MHDSLQTSHFYNLSKDENAVTAVSIGAQMPILASAISPFGTICPTKALSTMLAFLWTS